jgi:D-alanine-D-alanine ligase
MRVGITYDLKDDYLAEGYSEEAVAEFDRPDTIAAIAGALARLGHATDRIGNARHLIARLAAGDRWDLVFNIAEGLHGLGRESLVPALLDAYRIPYTFSDPVVLGLSLHKGMAKHAVRDLGVPTPDFAVVDDPADAAAVNLPVPLFAKPVAEGTSKGIDARSKITDPQELPAVCAELLRTYRQPVLVETFLPGREFTVGLLGTGRRARAVGVLEVAVRGHAETDAYSFATKKNYHDLVDYSRLEDGLADRCMELALRVWRGLGCRDAGRVDIRLDAADTPNFLEVNPLAGLHPIDSDLPIICRLSGIEYDDLIGQIMQSASERL